MTILTPKKIDLSPGLFRDLSEGIQQLMYFWGLDVIHPEGNFLLTNGFDRSPSKGMKGTSCYRKSWQSGSIELYGSCAGWYGKGSGFAFIRPKKKCFLWLSDKVTPIPGEWQDQLINRPASLDELYIASQPFLDWILFYERAVRKRYGIAYRMQNYMDYQKVPMAKAWIEPLDALRWFRCFRKSPQKLERARKFL